MRDTIISLFDYSGNWPRPYRENGYAVIQVDLQHGTDIMTWDYHQVDVGRVYGIMAAVPCTDFASSGAEWFTRKDSDGTTRKSITLVYRTLEIIDYFKPVFWVIENPVSRIHKLVPRLGPPGFIFQPYEFAQYDPVPRNSQYQKTTWTWGRFNDPIPRPLPNLDSRKIYYGYGGNSKRTKNGRSVTPLGFAYAFYEANHNPDWHLIKPTKLTILNVEVN